VQQIERLGGGEPRVVRNDRFDPQALLDEQPAAIVISPGPGTPDRAGRVLELIRLNERIPLLGVCLGHQALGEAFGARVMRGAAPVHGKVTDVRHAGGGLFEGCPTPMRTARYHSLIVDRASLPDVFRVDAETDDGVIMAISHRSRPLFGIQFHPESYGTVGGDRIITNFLGVRASRPHRSGVSPDRTTPPDERSGGCGRDARAPHGAGK
jgi:anthranilate synthase component 2